MSKFLVAYSKLVGLSSELPEQPQIEGYWAESFHAVLDELAKEFDNEDFLSFKLEESAIRQTSIKRGGQIVSTGRTYCDSKLLRAKVKAVMTYIQMQSSGEEQKKIIGFHG